MNWYKKNQNEWKNIIDTVSNELSKSPIMVEKDTIQSMFLFELSKCDLPFVFKGGTSLSKAYNLIDRFSEDIDLSMARKITAKEKKMSKDIIMNIGNTIGLSIKNLPERQSKYDYNKYLFEYDSLLSDKKMKLVLELVIIKFLIQLLNIK